MEELHDAVDKLLTEVDHLDRIMGGGLEPKAAELALSVAKRVRRHSTLVVRAIAQYREELQPEEA